MGNIGSYGKLIVGKIIFGQYTVQPFNEYFGFILCHNLSLVEQIMTFRSVIGRTGYVTQMTSRLVVLDIVRSFY
jgi:hypothetical protein